MSKIYCEDTKEKVKGYKNYLQTEHWKNKRIKIAKQRGMKCEKCGKKIYEHEIYHIHHKTYKRIGNELDDDLMLLCPECHSDIHKKLKEEKERKKAEKLDKKRVEKAERNRPKTTKSKLNYIKNRLRFASDESIEEIVNILITEEYQNKYKKKEEKI